MSAEYSKKELNNLRSKGVRRAWKREKELVKQGRGTRQWTQREQRELLRDGRVKGYQGHHMKSVSKYPQYADNPSNIQFLCSKKGKNEHLAAHQSDYRNASDGRYNVKTGKIRQLGEGAPRAMKSQALNHPVRKNTASETPAQQYAKSSFSSAASTRSPSPYKKSSGQTKSYQRSMVKKSPSSQSKSATKSTYATKSSGKSAGKSAGRSSSGGKSKGSGRSR